MQAVAISLTVALLALSALLTIIARNAARNRRLLAREVLCPKCGIRALEMVNFIESTVHLSGERIRALCTLHICRACGAKLKRRALTGQWEYAQGDDLTDFEPVETKVRVERPLRLTKFGILACLALHITSFFVAVHAGAFLFLIHHYGLNRVWAEKLWFVAMPGCASSVGSHHDPAGVRTAVACWYRGATR